MMILQKNNMKMFFEKSGSKLVVVETAPAGLRNCPYRSVQGMRYWLYGFSHVNHHSSPTSVVWMPFITGFHQNLTEPPVNVFEIRSFIVKKTWLNEQVHKFY